MERQYLIESFFRRKSIPDSISNVSGGREIEKNPTLPPSRHFRGRHCYGPTLLILRNGLLLSLRERQ